MSVMVRSSRDIAIALEQLPPEAADVVRSGGAVRFTLQGRDVQAYEPCVPEQRQEQPPIALDDDLSPEERERRRQELAARLQRIHDEMHERRDAQGLAPITKEEAVRWVREGRDE